MLVEAVDEMIGDDGFQLGCRRMTEAVDFAKKLKEWMPKNEHAVTIFEEALVKQFKRCSCEGMANKDSRANSLSKFHNLRCSEAFTNIWKVFLSPLDSQFAEDPIFYQHISRKLFNNYIKQTFPIPNATTSRVPDLMLSFEEENALRYVAGYVCLKVYKKIRKSSDPKKDDLLLGIVDLIDDDYLATESASSSWVKIVDRGGLVHVHESVYSVFLNIELIVRFYLQKEKATTLPSNLKDKIMYEIIHDAEILSLIEIELEACDRMLLLEKVTELYITIRGFSFARSCIELHKQSSKKTLQKSRALRSKLSSAESESSKDSS